MSESEGLTQEEYEEILGGWLAFTGRIDPEEDLGDAASGGAEEPSVDSGGDADTDEESAADTETESEDGDVPDVEGSGELVMEVNERVAQANQEEEESLQEQLPAGEDEVAVGGVDDGVRIHYDAEDHDAVMQTKADLVGEPVDTMWDFFGRDSEPPEDMISDREGYDRIWLIDVSTTEPFGPYSPANFDIGELVDLLEPRLERDALLVSDVYELE